MNRIDLSDPLPLACSLIEKPSVTPADAGALDALQSALESLGFKCRRLAFGEGEERVENLYARLGGSGPNFCFAGHTDVVPEGRAEDWSADPFTATVKDGILMGRGASDMKSAIAAFVAAVARLTEAGGVDGSISLLITGDEEGPAINGTKKVLEWMKENAEHIDHCLVGEPTNPHELGEMIKIGRRGSLNGVLTVTGIQGHAAYPTRADNPIPRILKMLDRLENTPLDDGTGHFQPSRLVVTSVDTGNRAHNIIPAQAVARFNIRFNDRHTAQSLIDWVREQCDAAGGRYELETHISGDPFITEPGWFTDTLSACIEKITGKTPELSTSGGTSDARFIKDYCPVVEFGLIGATMHMIDEHVALEDINRLSRIYEEFLSAYFAGPA